MSFSRISKVLVSFAFLGVFACGIISAQEPVSSANSVEEKVTDDTSSADASSEKDDVVCKDMGSFKLDSTLVKQTSHFGLFKDENGSLIIKDITDDNKDDKSKKGDCKSYKVTYTCCIYYCPSCEEDKAESEPDTSKKEDEVKFESESKVDEKVESSENVKSSEQ